MLALIFISQIYTIPLFLTGPWNNTASKAKQLGRDRQQQQQKPLDDCLHCPGRSAHIVRPFEFYHRHIPTPSSSSSHILFATIRVRMLTGASVGAAGTAKLEIQFRLQWLPGMKIYVVEYFQSIHTQVDIQFFYPHPPALFHSTHTIRKWIRLAQKYCPTHDKLGKGRVGGRNRSWAMCMCRWSNW